MPTAWPAKTVLVNLFVSQTDASAIGEYDDLVVGIIDVGQSAGRRGWRADCTGWPEPRSSMDAWPASVQTIQEK
jgi:hypothetical protein